jgi:hypothetical protein
MKVKSIGLALFVLGLTASFTLAAAPVGSSKSYDSTPSSTTTPTSSTTTITGSSTVSHGGTLNALSPTSITVDALTCAISTGSPSTTGFKVGDHVGIGCINGVLTVLVELPASGTSSTDSISALSSTSITVGQLTCAINGGSPSLTGFTVGERVAAACTNGTLVTIVPLPPLGGPVTATTTTTTTTTPSGITTTGQGTVTALSATSITVNTIGTGPLTCTLTSSSPSTSSFEVGDYVGLGCGNGVLLVIVPKSGDDGSPAYAEDPISALSGTSITVGSLTCTIDSSSPSLTSFAIGERVGIQCTNGVLTAVRTPSTTPATAQGPITALSTSSITVGSLTCSVDISSPSLTGYQLGEQATIGCVNGVLGRISVAPKLALQLGTISALSSSSITVGSLTCTIDSSSPSLTGVNTGDRVGMVCVDGVLGLVVPLPGPSANTTRKATTIKHDLLLRYSACVKHPGQVDCRKATVRLKHDIRR